VMVGPLFLFLLSFCLSFSLPVPGTFLWNPQDLVQIKQRVLDKDPLLKLPLQNIDDRAKSHLKQMPWSVMDKKVLPPSGDKHDYMSLDKYYWPCTAHPNGTDGGAPKPCNTTTGLPYIQFDGYVNPEMKLYDHDNCIDMTQAVIDLGIGYYFTDNEDYATKAILFIKTWFIDDATKMNPNLNYGHFIPGVVNGSHGAIIDTRLFVEMLDAVALIKLSNSWTPELDRSFNTWFTKFLEWLRTSPLGVQEDKANNNHGVWYDVQVGFIALHVGNSQVSQKIAESANKTRVEKQIQPDGQLPQEEARTKSWSYTEFCTDAFFHLAIFARSSSVDLFDSRIRITLDWQMPYIQLKKSWPYQQIVPFVKGCNITDVDQCIGSYFNILRIAANQYADSTYENTIKTLPGINYEGDVLNLLFPKKY